MKDSAKYSILTLIGTGITGLLSMAMGKWSEKQTEAMLEEKVDQRIRELMEEKNKE